MLRFIAAVAVLAASVFPALAFDTPRALLEAIYQPYLTAGFDWNAWQAEDVRSNDLNALFAKDAAETPEGMVGRIDFDPYINAQDFDLKNLAIGEPAIEGDRATLDVRFVNFSLPQHMTFALIKETDGWKVDDVLSHDANFPYSLRTLLTEPLPQ